MKDVSVQLRTERLTIRRVREEDWTGLKRIWEDFSTSAYAQYDMPHATADDDVRQRVSKWAAFSHSSEHMFFAISAGDTIIGYIAFNRRENSHEAGYCFLSGYHGKGYARESFDALFPHLRMLGIKRITARTAMANAPSVALLKSSGFRQIGTECVSFYKDTHGNDIIFAGGIFELMIGEA